MSIQIDSRRTNQKTRLIKMLKHFLQNDERFYQLSDHIPTDLTVSTWNQLQNRIRTLTTRSIGNWKAETIVDLVNRLYADEFEDLRVELLESFDSYYRVIAESIVNEVIQESEGGAEVIDSGLHFYRYCLEGLTENEYGDKPVRSDLYLSKEGILVVLKPLKERPSVFSDSDRREMRTAYRVKHVGDPAEEYQREKIIHLYKTRSLVLAEQYNKRC